MPKDPVVESHRRYNASYQRNKEVAGFITELLKGYGVPTTSIDVDGEGITIRIKQVE